ncbi:MAG: DUF2520 domain-containing protein [Planctomycetota bacterium]
MRRQTAPRPAVARTEGGAYRLCIVGPGRVGRAIARRWVDRGSSFLGFVGRDPARTAEALAFSGAGKVLGPGDVSRADLVLFAVGDAELPGAIASLAASGAPRGRRSVWAHTSGVHGLEVFEPLEGSAVLRGGFHPVCPFPDPEQGLLNLEGSYAVLLDGGGAIHALRGLAGALSMKPLEADPSGDRVLYHAACVLAANGLTALFDLCERVLEAAGSLRSSKGRELIFSLMRSALASSAGIGAAAALSGPVVRGDADAVRRHVERLAPIGQDALDAYLALQRLALRIADARGIDPARRRALRELIRAEPET